MKELVIINLRPLSQQYSLNDFTHSYNIKVISNPLFKEQLNQQKLSLSFLNEFSYIILTSKYALGYLVDNRLFTRAKLFIVGQSLYHKALDYFAAEQVIYGGKDSAELLRNIIDKDNFLYLRGEEISSNLKAHFKNNKKFEEFICYKMVPNKIFREEIFDYIQMNKEIIIPVFSLKSAQEFYSLWQKNIGHNYKDIQIIAFSKKIGEYFQDKFNKIIVAEQPEISQVIDIIIKIWESFNEQNLASNNNSFD